MGGWQQVDEVMSGEDRIYCGPFSKGRGLMVEYEWERRQVKTWRILHNKKYGPNYTKMCLISSEVCESNLL